MLLGLLPLLGCRCTICILPSQRCSLHSHRTFSLSIHARCGLARRQHRRRGRRRHRLVRRDAAATLRCPLPRRRPPLARTGVGADRQRGTKIELQQQAAEHKDDAAGRRGGGQCRLGVQGQGDRGQKRTGDCGQECFPGMLAVGLLRCLGKCSGMPTPKHEPLFISPLSWHKASGSNHKVAPT